MGKLALLVIDYSYAGGVERVTSLLAGMFTKNDFPLEYIISLKSGFPVPYMSYPKDVKQKVLFPGNVVLDFEEPLTAFLKEETITTLIFQGDNIGISFRILSAAAKAGCKAILHYHGSPYGYLKKYIYPRDIKKDAFNILKLAWDRAVMPIKIARLKKLILQCKDGFVCVSEGARQEIFSLTNLSEAVKRKIKFIPNPLTFEKKEINFSKKENIVIYVARLERRHKNSMLIAEAWSVLANRYPAWEMIVLGEGSIMHQMKAFCTEKNMQNISFEGVVNNVDEYLERSSISVLSSDCEGLPMGMLESAAYGNALVSTKSNGGITDIIQNGISGLLVERNDAKAFAEKVEFFILQPQERQKMARAAAEKIYTFSAQRIINDWKELLS